MEIVKAIREIYAEQFKKKYFKIWLSVAVSLVGLDSFITAFGVSKYGFQIEVGPFFNFFLGYFEIIPVVIIGFIIYIALIFTAVFSIHYFSIFLLRLFFSRKSSKKPEILEKEIKDWSVYIFRGLLGAFIVQPSYSVINNIFFLLSRF